MKKLLALLLALVMVFALAACGGPAPAPAHPFVRPAFDTRCEDAYEEIKRVLDKELNT